VSLGSASGAGSVVVVRASRDLHAALLAHMARRLRTAGAFPAVDSRVETREQAAAAAGAPIFREIATQLGLPRASLLSSEPQTFAEAIAQAASAKHSAIVTSLPKEGSWDRAVANELVRIGRTVVVFVTSSEIPTWDGIATSTIAAFDLAGDLSAADKLR